MGMRIGHLSARSAPLSFSAACRYRQTHRWSALSQAGRKPTRPGSNSQIQPCHACHTCKYGVTSTAGSAGHAAWLVPSSKWSVRCWFMQLPAPRSMILRQSLAACAPLERPLSAAGISGSGRNVKSIVLITVYVATTDARNARGLTAEETANMFAKMKGSAGHKAAVKEIMEGSQRRSSHRWRLFKTEAAHQKNRTHRKRTSLRGYNRLRRQVSGSMR